jgi:hypothetical protein
MIRSAILFVALLVAGPAFAGVTPTPTPIGGRAQNVKTVTVASVATGPATAEKTSADMDRMGELARVH